jgi:hypothetical protein
VSYGREPLRLCRVTQATNQVSNQFMNAHRVVWRGARVIGSSQKALSAAAADTHILGLWIPRDSQFIISRAFVPPDRTTDKLCAAWSQFTNNPLPQPRRGCTRGYERHVWLFSKREARSYLCFFTGSTDSNLWSLLQSAQVTAPNLPTEYSIVKSLICCW